MWLFAKCIEATRAPGFVYAQHRTDGVYHRAGHVRRNGDHDAGIPPVTFTGIVDHVPGITGHVGSEYSVAKQLLTEKAAWPPTGQC